MDLRIEGIRATQDYLEQVRQRILAGIRTGMTEGMEGLAVGVVEKLGEVTKPGSGELAASILRSTRITEKPDAYIAGSVSTSTGRYRNLGLWLEFGTKVPAVEGALFGFVAAGGNSVFTHGHAAFQVAPHAFFNPTFREYYPTILDTINQRIAEACDGSI